MTRSARLVAPQLGHAAAIVVAAVPMLSQYSIGLGALLFVDVIILILLGVAALHRRLRFPKWPLLWLGLALAYALWMTVFGAMEVGFAGTLDGVLIVARISFYLLAALSIGTRLPDPAVTLGAFVVVGSLNAAYSLLQLLAFRAVGHVLPWSIPFLPQRANRDLLVNYEAHFATFGFRPSGLFTEPAHLAQYLGIVLLVLLFVPTSLLPSSLRSLRIPLGLLLCVALLTSGSGLAYFVLGFSLSVALLNLTRLLIRGRSIRSSVLVIGFAVVLILAPLAVVAPSEYLTRGFVRATTHTSTASALYVRVLRSYDYVVDTQRWAPMRLVFGYGFGSYEQVLRMRNALTPYEAQSGFVWINSFGLLVSGAGLVGVSLFLGFFYSVYQRRGALPKALSLYLVSGLFVGDIVFSATGFSVLALCLITTERGR